MRSYKWAKDVKDNKYICPSCGENLRETYKIYQEGNIWKCSNCDYIVANGIDKVYKTWYEK